MLVLTKELELYEFEQEFKDELQDVGYEGIIIIFEALSDIMADGGHTVTDVRDYLRYQLQVLSVGDVVNDYGYIMDGLDVEDLESPETIEAIEEFLIHKTYVMGKFEENGITYFIFDEF